MFHTTILPAEMYMPVQ